MDDTVMQTLTHWETFYVIVGSSGAALTGLQFVVMALVAESPRRASHETINAFGTPTIVHFCVVLFLAAMLSVPWESFAALAIILGLVGAGGVAYVVVTMGRALRQADYKPVLEDWLWHSALPFAAYATLFLGATVLVGFPRVGLFSIATTSLLLLLIGIHNAWDTVTYIVIDRAGGEPSSVSVGDSAPADPGSPE